MEKRAYLWWAATACVLLVPTIMYPGALPGDRVVSLDDHLSVHHAFQEHPGGRVHNPVLSDPAVQLKALRRRVVQALEHGEPPLWNPDIFCGAPLLGDGQAMVGSPVTWFRLFLPEDQAQDAGTWWLLAWAGLGTLLLLGRLKAGPWGALAGAIATMTGPFLGVWLQYPLAGSFVWIPWVLLGVEHCKDGGSPAWLGLGTAAMLGGGHPDPAAYGAMLALLWAIPHRRRLHAMLGLALGGLLAAPLWLPLAEQLAHSSLLGTRGGYRLEAAQLLDLLWPGWFGHPAAGGYRGPGVWEDGVIHPGFALLFLLPFSVRTGKGRLFILLWALAVVGAVAGLPGPMHHSRLAQYGAWFLALAAGMGVAQLPRRFRWVVPLAILATGLWARRWDLWTLEASEHDPEPAAWTQTLSRLTGEGRVVGLGWALQPNTGALAGLRDVRGYDLPTSEAWERFARALDPDTHPLWYPIRRLTPSNTALLRFAAVRYVLARDDVKGLTPVDVGVAPLKIMALDPNAPRAWLAKRAERVEDAQSALRYLESTPGGRARPPVEWATGRPTPGTGATGRIMAELVRADDPGGAPAVVPITPVDPGPREVLLQVAPAEASLLVLADAWAPGWEATVDGEPRSVLRVGGYFRGVIVGPGDRVVRFWYAPLGWKWGLRLFAIGLLIVLVELACWGIERARSGSPRPPVQPRNAGAPGRRAGKPPRQ